MENGVGKFMNLTFTFFSVGFAAFRGDMGQSLLFESSVDECMG